MNSCFLALFVLVGTAFAQTATPPAVSPTSAHATVEVWPEGKMPRNDGFHRITNVSRPTLTLFPVLRKAGAAAAPAMIVCPGGGKLGTGKLGAD